ncbi:MAG: rRNA (guanine527-N7)-methyltransferase [Chloroflexota bacterium]|nr:rRNA (guanine527-N7)-methyltransferase [Chloroflexota bacterium]
MDNRVDSVGHETYCPASAPIRPGDRGWRGVRGNPTTNRTSRGRPGPRRLRRTTTPGAEPGWPPGTDRQEECLDRPRDPLPTHVESCPALPAAYDDALDQALLGLGIDLDDGSRATIGRHVRLLLAWNAAINLTAIREPAAIAVRHVADSLTALGELRRRGIDRFIDLGSGGGFPGIPLAAALPADRALLIDSVGKKVRFLATVVDAVGLGAHVAAEAARSESLATEPHDRGRWPAVTARAVAPLGELVELALPLLRPGGVLVAWKRDGDPERRGLDVELAAGRRAAEAIDPEARLAIVPAVPAERARAAASMPALTDLRDHRLVFVERGSRDIDPVWPRDPATRRRQPW